MGKTSNKINEEKKLHFGTGWFVVKRLVTKTKKKVTAPVLTGMLLLIHVYISVSSVDVKLFIVI